MLVTLREDRFEASGWSAVLTNDFDTIDEQEEQARAEVRLTGELFAFPSSEAFCGMTGYSPPERLGRDGRNEPKIKPKPKPTPRRAAIGKQPPAPLWGLREPTQKPIFQRLYNIWLGDEFTVIWPGNAINERVFVCIERSEIMFDGGKLKDAVVFDYDGREMRIEARACWPVHVFNTLNKEPGI